MAVTSFIPELWSPILMRELEKAHVATAFVNRDYEGEIKKMGDTVHVNRIGAITVKPYTKNQAIDAPEELDTTDDTLEINKASYFNFAVDDVDKAQAAGTILEPAMTEAAYQMRDDVDADIFKTMIEASPYSNANNNRVPHKVITTPGEAYELIVKLRNLLSKNNVPRFGRKLAVDTDFYGLLLEDPRFVSAGTEKTDERLEDGLVGRAAGFDIYETNNIGQANTDATTKKQALVAAVTAGTSFAEQVTEMEAYRPERRFADAVKGLNVYGVKVFRPECIGVATYEIQE